MLVTRSAGSDLIVALCKAGWAEKALKVYRDMMASAWGSSTGAAKHAQPGSGQQKAAPSLQACSDACSTAPAASRHASGVQDHADTAHNSGEGIRQSVTELGGPDAETGPSDNDRGSGESMSEHSSSAGGLVRPVRKVAPDPEHKQAVLQPSTAGTSEHIRPRDTREGGMLVAGLPLQRQKAASHSKKQKGQPILIPHIAAVGALVGALARSGDLNTALELYAQVCVSNLHGIIFEMLCFEPVKFSGVGIVTKVSKRGSNACVGGP